MADATPVLVNVGSTVVLDKGTVLRVTFADDYTFFEADPNRFAARLASIWENMAGLGYGYPISPNPAVPGHSGVIDYKLARPVSLADLLKGFNTIVGYWVTVTRVERLTEAKASIAAGSAGAVEREEVKKQETALQAAQASNGPIDKALGGAARALGVTLSVAKWIAIAVVLVAIIWAASQAKGAFRK